MKEVREGDRRLEGEACKSKEHVLSLQPTGQNSTNDESENHITRPSAPLVAGFTVL